MVFSVNYYSIAPGSNGGGKGMLTMIKAGVCVPVKNNLTTPDNC